MMDASGTFCDGDGTEIPNLIEKSAKSDYQWFLQDKRKSDTSTGPILGLSCLCYEFTSVS